MFPKTKKCSRCGIEQPLENFIKDRTRKDGLFPYCKSCKSKAKREYYLKNKEKVLAKSREWVEKNRKRSNEIKRNYRIRNWAKIRERIRKQRSENPERFKEYTRRYYLKNKEKILQKQRVYRERFPEKRKEYYQRYYAMHREKILSKWHEWYTNNTDIHAQRVKSWQSRNKDKRLAITHKRRALILNNGGSYTAQEWEELKRKYNYTCLCCGRREPEIKLTVDHVIPLSKGGKNDITNIQPLCKTCNQSKHTRIIDYRRGCLYESS